MLAFWILFLVLVKGGRGAERWTWKALLPVLEVADQFACVLDLQFTLGP